jgi:hypothetical protein
MSATCWNPTPSPVFDANGRLAGGAQAFFYEGGTSEPLTVYTTAALTVAHAFPVVASSTGVFPPVFLPYGDYRARVLSANDDLLYDVDNIANPAPPEEGGGSGIVVSSDMVFQTGFTLWIPCAISVTKWVRMNGRTIGSAISGATERANSDTQALFLHLWGNYSNTDAPVSSGRGASAAADWAANKTIGIPSMRGLAPIGLDDMGGSAAQKIQIVGTCDATNGSADIQIASTGGLARGMYIIIDSAAAGQIDSISGTTVTLDTAYAGTSGTGLSYRASFFEDAQSIGKVGGEQSISATTAELPEHTHGTTETAHSHNYFVGTTSGSTLRASGVSGDNPGASIPTSGTLTGLTIDSAGSGLPIRTLPPSRLGNWWIKL